MGCKCSVCRHRYVCDCEGAYCNCCLESEHRVDTMVTDEDEILQMTETKYIFAPAWHVFSYGDSLLSGKYLNLGGPS